MVMGVENARQSYQEQDAKAAKFVAFPQPPISTFCHVLNAFRGSHPHGHCHPLNLSQYLPTIHRVRQSQLDDAYHFESGLVYFRQLSATEGAQRKAEDDKRAAEVGCRPPCCP